MHDINGKVLHIGSDIHSCVHGLCKIIGMQEEHNPDEGGAAIIVLPRGKTESVSLRTHSDKVVRVRTWKEMAIEALAVQDACNLSGVVVAFTTIISEVRTRLESEGKGGTDNVNAHPVCQLFSDKIAQLTDTQLFGNDKVAKAYVWAHDLKEGKAQ